MNFRKLFGYASLLAVLVLGYFALSNQQDIKDWWYLRSYQPSAEIQELADASGFSEQGRDYFYVSDPQISGKEEFNDFCVFEEQTIVLGCYDGRYIFILDINDPELEGVEIVTAAHEMLHAAYSRLSDTEREEVDQMVNEQFAKTTNKRIKQLIAEYDQNDQALINNELHSILPTELEKLMPELEAYYDELFDDRQKVVRAAKNYESVFVRLDDKLNSLESQLNSYKAQISAYESQLATMSAQIAEGRAELDRLEGSGNAEAYNARVPGFNALVGEYNATIEQLQAVLDQHNTLVVEINETALKHNDLVNSIDSSYEEL